MNLIEIYIQEVTRRLPEKSREDIALELRSTIEDMLPDEYNEEDVKHVLEKLGSPVLLASNYQDRPMHLIGPRYFDVYVSLLKMILPIAVVIALISMIAEYAFQYTGQENVLNTVINIITEGIVRIISVGIQTFFWLTVVFAVIERTDKNRDMQPLTASLKKWTPDDLKNVTYIPKKRGIPKLEVFGSFLWTAIWATCYFNAERLIGIYENTGDGLVFVTPSLNQEVLNHYWPLVLVSIGLELVLALYKSIKWQWTKKLAVFNLVKELIVTILFIIIVIDPNLFQQDFVQYMTDLFSVSASQLKGWILGLAITSFVIAATINVFDGFRKSKI